MKTSMAARSWRVCFVAAYCCLRIASPGLAEQPPAAGVAVSASSQWGPGFGADAAVDGIAGENLNYWQTVQGTDKGAWWQADLGEVVPVYGLSIAWARYQNKYHSPPATAVVQVSSTGAADSWKDALVIGSGGIPRDESSYEPDRIWKYPLPVPAQARYVRLLFPEGDQPGARYEGYLCIGEVEIQAPGIAPQMVTIEAAFGKAEVNASRPALVRLFLQSGEGPGRQSLLATHGRRSWARGGCTYVVGEDGTRYESRTAKPGRVNVTEESGRTVLKITGAGLAPSADGPPVAVEDWTLSSPGDGSKLVWKVVRRWQKDFTSVLDGSPGLFFSFDARHRPNSTTSTIWYDPLRIVAGTSDLYRLAGEAGRTSQQHLQVLRDRDTWAVYKLWTNWDSTADLRLEVEGGHLYRRGSFSWLSEAGAASGPSWRQSHRAGEVEKITLAIGGVEKRSTGYQLAVTLPDKPTETSLKRFYDSVLNGGAVNDQKGFDFGNETDGWYYAGSCWMYGAALSAGVPAPAPASFHPYDAAQAFREHLAHVLSTVDDEGRARFGYNQGGQWVDDNLHTIIGFRFYLLHTGDLPFIRQNLQSLERMLQYFIRRRGSQGLFELDDVGAHWYYDAITTSGVNGYHNAFFYKAAMDLAEMEEAAGKAEQAARYRELAGAVKDAYNRVLWKEDAPGGPRYLDWIDSKGREVSYFCDLCQWPPVAVGIASAQQARKIVATADARIAELEKEHGYAGDAGLSALWPVPPDLNPHPWQTFGRYMNGGSLLCQTYWEILARAKAGDAAGAAARLKRFARRAAETRWAGDNAADIR
ncbi:MAG: discoidin domain-containing protein, partial [Pirellulales bacterium]|nr:discoidin domain-containing protein [Pirellulales bacterium]